MNDVQRKQIGALRAQGVSYGRIAQALGISENTIKTYCKRHDLGGSVGITTMDADVKHFCFCCGNPVIQLPGRKEKRFCSDKCRNRWWNAHLDKVNRKAIYFFVCPQCKKSFSVYGNKNRKYCSHGCYIKDRFGGVGDE